MLSNVYNQKSGRIFLIVGGQEKYFHVSIQVSICRNRTFKDFENRSTDDGFMAKINFE